MFVLYMFSTILVHSMYSTILVHYKYSTFFNDNRRKKGKYISAIWRFDFGILIKACFRSMLNAILHKYLIERENPWCVRNWEVEIRQDKNSISTDLLLPFSRQPPLLCSPKSPRKIFIGRGSQSHKTWRLYDLHGFVKKKVKGLILEYSAYIWSHKIDWL